MKTKEVLKATSVAIAVVCLSACQQAPVTQEHQAHALRHAAPRASLPAITTRSSNNLRTGVYQDSILTADAVRMRGLRVFFELPMEGDRVGADAQPLIAPGITVQDGGRRDLCLVASENGLLYAFDANSSDIVWVQKVGVPVNGGKNIDFWNTNDHQSMLSTGVVDMAAGIWYTVAWTSPDGTPQHGTHALYGVSLKDGSKAIEPIQMPAEYDSVMRKQRVSLALATFGGRKTILFAAGTVLETASTSAGYLTAVDLPSRKVSLFRMVQKGWGAGIWQSGGGLVVDEAKGWVFGVSGNGTFDPASGSWSETLFRAAYTVDSSGSGHFAIADWFTPYTDPWRAGKSDSVVQPSNRLAGHSLSADAGLPVNAMAGAHAMPNGMTMTDEDLGSGPPIYIQSLGMVIASGKDGVGYAAHAGNLGKTQLSDANNPSLNFAKLVAPPFWYAAYAGAGVSADPATSDALNRAVTFDGKTHHQHFGSVVYQSRNHGVMVIGGGENANVRAWQATNSGLTYLANSDDIASPQGGGMTGWGLAATTNGLLIATRPRGDANRTDTPGDLFIYDLENLGTRPDGSKQLRVLWRSDQHNVNFLFSKFCPPVVYNGKVFLPTFSDTTLVLGLN